MIELKWLNDKKSWCSQFTLGHFNVSYHNTQQQSTKNLSVEIFYLFQDILNIRIPKYFQFVFFPWFLHGISQRRQPFIIIIKFLYSFILLVWWILGPNDESTGYRTDGSRIKSRSHQEQKKNGTCLCLVEWFTIYITAITTTNNQQQKTKWQTNESTEHTPIY